MSHITKVNIEVKDLGALQVAAEKLGLVFREGQQSYKWYGAYVGDTVLPEGVDVETLGTCDHALSVPGNSRAYEIGIKARADGSGFDLLYDFWCGGFGLYQHVGDGCSKLIGAYAIEAARNAALAQGWISQDQGDTLVIYHPDGGTLTVSSDGTVDCSQFAGSGCVSAAASVEAALGSQSVRTLKGEFYQDNQALVLPEAGQ